MEGPHEPWTRVPKLCRQTLYHWAMVAKEILAKNCPLLKELLDLNPNEVQLYFQFPIPILLQFLAQV